MADHSHAPRPVIGDDSVFRLNAAREIDLQLLVARIDHHQVGMHALLRLAAGQAGPAGPRPTALAQDRGG